MSAAQPGTSPPEGDDAVADLDGTSVAVITDADNAVTDAESLVTEAENAVVEAENVVTEADNAEAEDAEVAVPEERPGTGFKVNLANFTGPFDLLLQLIGKHKLDVTEVALHTVTDEFIAYIRAMGDDWDLDEVSEFLVIASTLLDLKAARLLPSAAVEDEEDLALLEARDLLFARLLQYKAFKEAAAFLSRLEQVGAKRWPRMVALEPQFAQALPELVLGIGPQRLADLALAAMRPKVVPTVGLSHVHMERVSVREHAARLRDVLMRQQVGTFRALSSDCQSTLEVVARFLALLELYREGLVNFDQVEALGELTVRWIGPTDQPVELDVDEYAGTPAEDVRPATASIEDASTEDIDDADAVHDVDAMDDVDAVDDAYAVDDPDADAVDDRLDDGTSDDDDDVIDVDGADVDSADVSSADVSSADVSSADVDDADVADTDSDSAVAGDDATDAVGLDEEAPAHAGADVQGESQ